MDKGWIKMHRRFIDWKWYYDGNTMRVFFHILLTCNYEAKNWENITIESGQLVTSLSSLSSKLGISVKKIRLSLSKLKETGEVTIKTTNRYSIITVQNWSEYQNEGKQKDKQEDNQRASKGQAKGNQRATTKEVKKLRSKEVNTYQSDFEVFWEFYPSRNGKKIGKKKASELFFSLSLENKDKILVAVENYARSGQIAKDPERFIRNDYWMDWMTPATTGNNTRITMTKEGKQDYGI